MSRIKAPAQRPAYLRVKWRSWFRRNREKWNRRQRDLYYSDPSVKEATKLRMREYRKRKRMERQILYMKTEVAGLLKIDIDTLRKLEKECIVPPCARDENVVSRYSARQLHHLLIASNRFITRYPSGKPGIDRQGMRDYLYSVWEDDDGTKEKDAHPDGGGSDADRSKNNLQSRRNKRRKDPDSSVR